MNRIYMILAAALLILQACGGVKRVEKKAQVTTTPAQQQLFVNEKADPYTIQVNYTLNVPEDYVPSCARLVYAAAFEAPGHKYALTPVVITGKNYNRVAGRRQFFRNEQPDYPGAMQYITEDKDMQINVSQAVPFELWMPESKLVAEVMLEACDRETILYHQTLANGVFYFPQSPGPVIVKYVKKEIEKKEEGFAYFNYPVNGYIVDPSLYNNRQELNKMIGLIQKVVEDTLATVNRIVITGICSPDGSWAYNENLAKKRAENVKNYLAENRKIENSLLEVKYIAEDWSGLQKLIEASDIPDKQAALNIIDQVSDPDQREVALRRLPQFNTIKQNFYPQLRRVSYEIYYTLKETVVDVEPE